MVSCISQTTDGRTMHDATSIAWMRAPITLKPHDALAALIAVAIGHHPDNKHDGASKSLAEHPM